MRFDGLVDAGGKLDLDVRTQIAEYIRTYANRHIDVVVRAHTRQRSLDQNAYLHAEPFPKLAQTWGESIERTKLICMGEFWGYEPAHVNGIRVLLPVKVHTRDLTVEECTHFIDWLVPWALAEHGVAIRLPDEWQASEAA